MAEGGIQLDPPKFEDNLQEQENEIEVLQSIFEGEEDYIQVLSKYSQSSPETEDQLNMLKVYVPIEIHDGKLQVDVYQPLGEEETPAAPPTSTSRDNRLSVARSDSGQRVIWSFKARYLTPLCLHVTLPLTYPSHDAPYFVISCDWLSPKQMSVVCKQLDQLWVDSKPVDSPGMPILYTWVDWLKENLLTCLGIERQISVTSYRLDEEVDDCRVMLDSTDLNEIVTGLLGYSKEKWAAQFYRDDQECGVCLDVLPGRQFHLLPHCDHHVCRECLAAHCQVLVKDGAVLTIQCPIYECECNIPEYMIKDVLTDEEFQRYEQLCLQKALDVMNDVTWCPRCNSAVIREPEEGLHLAYCLQCHFSFCTECKHSWHQGEPCPDDNDDESQKIEVKKKEKAPDDWLKVKQKIENKESRKYIREMAGKCPSCGVPIMKTGGCNKVQCSRCMKSMCWCCGEAIDSYSHFSDNPRCNTFTVDRVENYDIRPPQGLAPRPAPPVRLHKGRVLKEMLKMRPELAPMMFTCPTCKALNQKEDKCNLIHCWNCKASICFMCRQRVLGTVGKHYGPDTPCRQHS